MVESILTFLVGWPIIALSVLLCLAGLFVQRPTWIMIGALLAIPLAFYLSATPYFRYWGLAIPLLPLAASYAIQQERGMLGLLLLLPYFGLVGWLAWSVFMG